MQGELDEADTGRPVHILGVNEVGHESGNDDITDGRALPWLQDQPGEDVWGQWNPTYRDVVILDGDNVRRYSYNLTEHDLARPANYEALRQALIDLANEAPLTSRRSRSGNP